jgi:succinate dehydrogenase / fumarate reductase flavoprotein subunit
MDSAWRKVNLICSLAEKPTPEAQITLQHKANPPIRTDLLELFETDELKKYLTADELPSAEVPTPRTTTDAPTGAEQ